MYNNNFNEFGTVKLSCKESPPINADLLIGLIGPLELLSGGEQPFQHFLCHLSVRNQRLTIYSFLHKFEHKKLCILAHF